METADPASTPTLKEARLWVIDPQGVGLTGGPLVALELESRNHASVIDKSRRAGLEHARITSRHQVRTTSSRGGRHQDEESSPQLALEDGRPRAGAGPGRTRRRWMEGRGVKQESTTHPMRNRPRGPGSRPGRRQRRSRIGRRSVAARTRDRTRPYRDPDSTARKISRPMAALDREEVPSDGPARRGLEQRSSGCGARFHRRAEGTTVTENTTGP